MVPCQRIRKALDHGVVDLVHRAFLEGPFERGVGVFGLGDHHDAGGADVEPVDDAGALGGTRGGDPVAGTGQAAHDGGSHPAGRRVRGDPHRLVDDHKVVVVQQDLQAFHNFLHDFQGVPAVRDRHVQHGAGRRV